VTSELQPGGTLLTLVQGDITQQDVDAIVNAANSSLLGGGGVDGAIHRAGGPAILEECKAIRARQGGCPAGDAVITGGGKLKARHVIHTVGPVWHGGQQNEEEILARAYRSSLLLATENNIRTIAFPSISTGVYGFPIDRASEIAVSTVKEFVPLHPSIAEIRFVTFSRSDHDVYARLFSSP
jgi:O-acetyl-ADP-ribose deacetylase (regulator of RNase III)